MRDQPRPAQDTPRTRAVRPAAPKIGKAVAPHLARLAKASGAMDPRLAGEWLDIAGPEIAALCRPVRIVNRGRVQALEVSVKSGAAGMKLRYHQEALLGRVRQRIGLPRLSQIVIREGQESQRWTSRRMEPVKNAEPRQRRTPQSPSLQAALEAMRQSMHKRSD